jgi:stage II sporulation protein AA (anti-sigma F factor antagonist)
VSQQGAVAIAEVRGEVDMANSIQFTDEILGKVSDDTTALVVDLTELEYIDSAGVRSLFEIASALRMRDQFLAIAVVEGSPLRSVLKVTQIEDVATVCPTRDAAVELAKMKDVQERA